MHYLSLSSIVIAEAGHMCCKGKHHSPHTTCCVTNILSADDLMIQWNNQSSVIKPSSLILFCILGCDRKWRYQPRLHVQVFSYHGCHKRKAVTVNEWYFEIPFDPSLFAHFITDRILHIPWNEQGKCFICAQWFFSYLSVDSCDKFTYIIKLTHILQGFPLTLGHSYDTSLYWL